jgi:pimeloyl-ACP methyl ester carboxylesterase
MATRTSGPSRGVPAQDDARTVALEGERRLAYAEYGRADGDPVVFFHGTPGSRRLASLFETTARERGVRLLAVDRPGYGRSDPWPAHSVADAGAVVEAVLDDVGAATAGAVAFSGGAPYALATAATRPDRIDRVDIVAGATPPDVGEETPAVQRLLGGLARDAPSVLGGLFRGQAWLAERLDPSFVVGQYTADGAGAVVDDVAAVVVADFLEAFARHRSGAVREFRETTTDWGIDFEAIDAPVRFWHGDDDTNVPLSGVRQFESRVPGAELHVLKDADHLRTLLRSVPDVLAEQVR